jgi:hypothetical protein
VFQLERDASRLCFSSRLALTRVAKLGGIVFLFY